ncbi:hypothetical protein G9A89_001629 [Geosiphon pyriformis]|nr:hypothetical protein G9A89_001629 [Geosiphon pyriformis]
MFERIFFLALVVSVCFFVEESYAGGGEDCFPDKVSVDPKSGFTVEYSDYYKTVTNLRANETYILYCTPTPPNVTLISVKSFIKVPVERVASLDLTTLAFLEMIGADSSLQYVENSDEVTSPCLLKANRPAFKNNSSAQVDLIFQNLPTNPDPKYVTISLADNLHPLQRLEWVKFVSLFYNREKNATAMFEKIQSNYKCHVRNIANVPYSSRKIVSWVSYDLDSKIWKKINNQYIFQLTQDAAAISSSNSTETFASLTGLQKAIDSSDILIDRTQFTAPLNTYDIWQQYFGYYQTSDSSAQVPSFIKYKGVYRTQKLQNVLGYDDWFETSRARPDLVLRDLIAVQYPTYEKTYLPTWFENFSKSDSNKIVTTENCVDTSHNTNPIRAEVASCTDQPFFGDDKGRAFTNNNPNSPPRRPAEIIYILIATGILLFIGAMAVILIRKKLHRKFFEVKDGSGVQVTSHKGEIQIVKGDK